ncbi:MAG: sigma-70 family RNA polymerase sigma factor [Planctomycetes bacterium]|nr:sigma-70 family RNA polymerase sigma factor [Planctomycetota bacterium]
MPSNADFAEQDSCMRAIAFGLLRNVDDADDAAQDAWLAAVAEPESKINIRRWLANVTKHFAIRKLRSDARIRSRETRAARADSVPSIATIIEREEARQRILAAILNLEEPYKTAILFRYFENLPPREIAARLGTPVETVKSRLNRGLAQLRNSLSKTLGIAWADWCLQIAEAGPSATAGLSAASGHSYIYYLLFIMSKKVLVSSAAVALAILACCLLYFGPPLRETGSDVSKDTKQIAIASLPSSKNTDIHIDKSAAASRTSIATTGSSPSNADADFASLVIRVLCDDRALPGVTATVACWGESEALLNARTVVTDAAGRAQLLHLAPGNVSVKTALGASGYIELVRGRENTLDIKIERGVSVPGRVVHSNDEPVPGASVLSEDGLTVAIADKAGRFLIECIAVNSSLIAIAHGYACSTRTVIHNRRSDDPPIKLVLSGPGCTLSGSVIDGAGQPVRGCSVMLIKKFTETDPDNIQGNRAESRRIMLRTDENGSFMTDSLAQGSITLCARAAGYAPSKKKIRISNDSPTRCDIVLEIGCVVEGSVFTKKGEPVAGASVGVDPYWIGEAPVASSDVNGKFKLTGVPAGVVKLNATDHRGGNADKTVTLGIGANYLWEVVLSRGPEISGQVVDESGKPLPGLFIIVPTNKDGNLWASDAVTDSAGKFILPHCAPGPNRVEVRGDQWSPLSFMIAKDNIYPDMADTIIVVPAAAVPSAFFDGKIVDESGVSVAGARIWIRESTSDYGPTFPVEAETGRFHAGPLKSGDYAIIVITPGRPTVNLGRKSARPHDITDLGSIIVEHGGQLRVLVNDKNGKLVGFSVICNIIDKDGVRKFTTNRDKNGYYISEPLARGNYRVSVEWSVNGIDKPRAETWVDVRSGAVADVTIQLDP